MPSQVILSATERLGGAAFLGNAHMAMYIWPCQVVSPFSCKYMAKPGGAPLFLEIYVTKYDLRLFEIKEFASWIHNGSNLT